jgi:hypothetical protein
MSTFVVILVSIWLLSVAVWWLVSHVARSSEMKRMRERITDDRYKKERKAKSASAATQLLATEDHKTGRLVLRLLHKFELSARLEALIEQSGLKWRAARVVHTSLALFLVAFSTSSASATRGWRSLRSSFPKASSLSPAPCAPATPSRLRSRCCTANFKSPLPVK